MDTENPVTEAVARALGDALRRAREALGLSRAAFVRKLPSGIGDRALLAYEHGIRQLTMVRFLELCEALGVSSADLLAHALQKRNSTSATSSCEWTSTRYSGIET